MTATHAREPKGSGRSDLTLQLRRGLIDLETRQTASGVGDVVLTAPGMSEDGASDAVLHGDTGRLQKIQELPSSFRDELFS